MNVLKNTKVLAFLAVVLGSVLLTGCGGREVDRKPLNGNWDAEVSAYFNDNLPPMKNLPGKVYDFQITKEGDNIVSRVFVDGAKAHIMRSTAKDKIPGTGQSIGAYAGVKIRWTKEEGYMVDKGRTAFVSSAADMIRGNYGHYWKDYL